MTLVQGLRPRATHLSGLLTGRDIVTSLMHFPLNPFWNKVKYQEFKKDHILKSSILPPGFLLSLPVVIRHWNSLKFSAEHFAVTLTSLVLNEGNWFCYSDLGSPRNPPLTSILPALEPGC